MTMQGVTVSDDDESTVDPIAAAIDRATEALREANSRMLQERPRPSSGPLYERSASFRELFIKLQNTAEELARGAEWAQGHSEELGLFSDNELHPERHAGHAARQYREAAALAEAAYRHANDAQNALGHIGSTS